METPPPPSFGFRELGPALSALPLFPLPTVLFPGALMPLHVFEPRYRAMIKDCLATHQALAVVLVQDATGADPRHPPIARMAGAGIIVDYTELPSGRFNILVRGRARVRLEEIPFVEPYRRAMATIVETPSGDVPEGEVAALASAATNFAARVREGEPNFEFAFPRDASAAALADHCAHYLVLDARERQAILETMNPLERVKRTSEALVVQRVSLSTPQRDLN